LALAPYDARALSSLGHLLGRMGRREEAGRLLKLLGEMYGKGRNLGYSIALVRMGLGDRAGALEWLEKAAETREPILPFVVVEPRFATLRGEARYGAVVRKLGL
ncbi:MAG: hypothetical protein ACRD96_14655, partial [Bryobacteraceae bacterium]